MLEYVEGNKYREKTEKGNRYYALVSCKICGRKYITNWYKPIYYCSAKCKGVSRGRPIGTELSNISKNKISESMKGLSKSEEARNKISKAIIKNYKKHPELKERLRETHIKYNIPDYEFYIYYKWFNIKRRCYDKNSKNYKYYGGKGINICEEWLNFMEFYKWLKEHNYEKGLHIHRIDPNGPYSPDNCIIMTSSEHSRLHNEMRKKIKKI